MSDRRARLFSVCAVVALLLIPFTPQDFDYVSVHALVQLITSRFTG